MATLNGKESQPVTLFPMFNILICTLGVFIFVMATVAMISLGVGKSIILTPEYLDDAADEPAKAPRYIEWTGRDLVLHPSRDRVCFDCDIHSIRTYAETYAYIDGALVGSPLDSLFTALSANREAEYVVLLVRPSGFENFMDLRGYIEKKGIDFGYEPVDQEWTLRLR